MEETYENKFIDPFGFINAINFDAIDEMEESQLRALLTVLEKVK